MDTLSKIFSLIKQNNIDQKDLANFLGIHGNIITDWKAGRSKSYIKYIDKIAEYFHVSADYLLLDSAKDINHTKLPPYYDAAIQLYNTLLEAGFFTLEEPLPEKKLKLLASFMTANRPFIEALYQATDERNS